MAQDYFCTKGIEWGKAVSQAAECSVAVNCASRFYFFIGTIFAALAATFCAIASCLTGLRFHGLTEAAVHHSLNTFRYGQAIIQPEKFYRRIERRELIAENITENSLPEAFERPKTTQKNFSNKSKQQFRIHLVLQKFFGAKS